MQKDTLAQLQKLSAYQRFSKDEYICYEGQMGDNMYVILEGLVGIYLTNTIGTLVEISRIGQGDFFGEMAIFDHLPRSASCIALEDTICISINKDNLKRFLETCPEIVEGMLRSMSLRIRSLNDKFYKTNILAKKGSIAKYSMPSIYTSHALDEPKQDPRYFLQYKQACPICGNDVNVVQFHRNLLTIESVGLDGRIKYASCDPLWQDVLSCPQCFYSNHYLKFFNVTSANYDAVKNALKDQYEAAAQMKRIYRTAYDKLVLKYLQAIYLNETVNAGDHALSGVLWLNLYWLGKDANDEAFSLYCAQNAADHLAEAIDEDQIVDMMSRCALALSLSNILVYLGTPENAMKYCTIAEKCPDERIRQQALNFKAVLK